MTQQPRSTGAEVRRQVMGEAHISRLQDPFMAPMYGVAEEHAWGGVWTRPGLELKQRSLIVCSVLVALGRQTELAGHFGGALRLGWTADELRELCIQIAPYAGFPAAIEATRVLAEVVGKRDGHPE
jgi:4-carboxymuconolactone decarboxylase